MNITELIGKRALITESDRFSSKKATEVKFLEVSPSGNWVKLMNMHGSKYWKPVQELSLIEALIDIEKPPKEE